jgi:transposase
MHLLQAGLNLIYIRDILGHASIKTTEIYARADSKQKRDALEKAYAEITEILEHEPAKCYVRRIIRHVYALKQSSEGESTVLTPSLPALPIPKSYAGASLLAEMMINKYVNHLPFYRQIQMFKQLGITLPPSTVNDWFKDTADLLRPLYYRLKELVLNSDYIQVDESTIPIVREEKHKYMALHVKWTMVTLRLKIWQLKSRNQPKSLRLREPMAKAQPQPL